MKSTSLNEITSAAQELARDSLMRMALGVGISLSAIAASFWMHFNLSTAASIQLLLIVLISLRLGFRQAAFVSVLALVGLNYFFTAPVLTFAVAQPENWVALITFEATALLASGLSSKVRQHAAQAEQQRARMAKLYELSKAILLIEPQQPTLPQLATLIRELIHVDDVEIWDVYHAAPTAPDWIASDSDDLSTHTSGRTLRLGTTPIGALVLRGWEVDAMMADAVASLCAVAVERARSFETENRAEAGRQTEQLRTTVLDGLAHAFKTPLTAILTASSGLLEIGALTPTQTELVTLIDEEALTLNTLTTRLLQTAALGSREIRLRSSTFAIATLIREIVEEEDNVRRQRIRVSTPEVDLPVRGDPQLIRFAVSQLVDNALKYSPVGSPIHVSARQHGSEMIVIVANLGTSIPAAERERIFERFYRGKDAAHGPTGTGLGLSIVKKTAEAHHGRAWVECDPTTTSFFFTIENHPGERYSTR